MPQEHHDYENEGQDTDRHANGRSGSRVRILPPPRDIPNLAQAKKDEYQRPVGRQHRPGIKTRTPIGVQKQRADRDQQNRKNERTMPGCPVLSHCTPSHSSIRTPAPKSSARVFLRMKGSIVSVVSAVKLLWAASPGHERSTLSMLEFA